MTVLRIALVIALAALSTGSERSFSQQSSPASESVPASCPVTARPARPFIPRADYRPAEMPEHVFFIGTNELWTEIHEPMVWYWAPHQPGHEQEVQPLTAKIFWGRVGYDWRVEPQPKLTITGRRLDGPAPPLMVMTRPRPNGAPAQATNVIIDDSGRGAMLTGIYVPVPGCWEITGDYEGDKLSFVVWVVPVKPDHQ